jgi:hypothetical protein
MALTDSTAVSNYLGRALTAYETGELTNIIASVTAWINKTLSSAFDQVNETTRYYDGGLRSLDIDPCTAISKVEALNDDGSDSYEYTATTEYIAEPQNETVKRELRKRLAPFPSGIHRIGVTAKFSEYDGGVPADIQLLATRLVAGVMTGGKNVSAGIVEKESLEGHSITYDVSQAAFEGLATGDATINSILKSRQELLIDNAEQDGDDDCYL